jgi:hypothetical protein
MTVPEWVKPAVWGVIGGAIAAIVIGFIWGGWVTGGAATKMEAASAEAAVIQVAPRLPKAADGPIIVSTSTFIR